MIEDVFYNCFSYVTSKNDERDNSRLKSFILWLNEKKNDIVDWLILSFTAQSKLLRSCRAGQST